jgi:hypothetical protein
MFYVVVVCENLVRINPEPESKSFSIRQRGLLREAGLCDGNYRYERGSWRFGWSSRVLLMHGTYSST